MSSEEPDSCDECGEAFSTAWVWVETDHSADQTVYECPQNDCNGTIAVDT